jgi:DNA-binding transcriptional ArsR family regulator
MTVDPPATGESSELKVERCILNHVVEDRDELSAVFRALGDPTRREMLRQLSAGERSVGELAQPFRMSLAAASKHVRVLERAGLVRRTVRGRTHRCRLEAARLADAQRWLAFYQRFWTERLDALDALLVTRDSRPTVDSRESAWGSSRRRTR